MIKYLIILTTCILLFTACQSGYKGEALTVISKELSNLENYKFYYALEGGYQDQAPLGSKETYQTNIHSNQDWNVGDTIHIGARWGKKND